MFTVGKILYFKPFVFKNGAQPKNKYFIVLKNTDSETILASLPTSGDHVPVIHLKDEGCIEVKSSQISCFVISPNIPVTKCGKCLELPTFIYASQLDTYNVDELKSRYPIEKVDYEVYGEMNQRIFNSLILCLKNANTLKRKYKPLFR